MSTITYGTIKQNLADLGFEENSEMVSEYLSATEIENVVTAINRALDVVWTTVVIPYISYFENKYDVDIDEEGFEHFFVDSDDEDTTEVPFILQPLIPLLAAHWLWLDDDLTKATIYWNEYDDLKSQIIAIIQKPYRAKIVGGF